MCGENSVHYWETPYAQPFFDNTTKRDITATVGQPALLHCRVRNLGDRAVSFHFHYFFNLITIFLLNIIKRIFFNRLSQKLKLSLEFSFTFLA